MRPETSDLRAEGRGVAELNTELFGRDDLRVVRISGIVSMPTLQRTGVSRGPADPDGSVISYQ